MKAETQEQVNPFNKIVLSTVEGYFPIRPEEIIYCQAKDNYTWLLLEENKQFTVSQKLKEFEALLVPHNFYRIHKSFLININHINMVNKIDGYTVVMSDMTELPVSYRKKDAFIRFIKSLHF